MVRILVVEDDDAIRMALTRGLVERRDRGRSSTGQAAVTAGSLISQGAQIRTLPAPPDVRDRFSQKWGR